MNTYRCNHCDTTVKRASEKRWIKSYCDRTGRMTRLWRVALPRGRSPVDAPAED